MRGQNCSSTCGLPAAQSSPVGEELISRLGSDLGIENSMYFPEILFQLRTAGLAVLCQVALEAFPPALPQSLPAGVESCPWEDLV